MQTVFRFIYFVRSSVCVESATIHNERRASAEAERDAFRVPLAPFTTFFRVIEVPLLQQLFRLQFERSHLARSNVPTVRRNENKQNILRKQTDTLPATSALERSMYSQIECFISEGKKPSETKRWRSENASNFDGHSRRISSTKSQQVRNTNYFHLAQMTFWQCIRPGCAVAVHSIDRNGFIFIQFGLIILFSAHTRAHSRAERRFAARSRRRKTYSCAKINRESEKRRAKNRGRKLK